MDGLTVSVFRLYGAFDCLGFVVVLLSVIEIRDVLKVNMFVFIGLEKLSSYKNVIDDMFLVVSGYFYGYFLFCLFF